MSKPPKITYASPGDPPIKTALIRSIEWLTGQRKLEKLYTGLLNELVDGEATFWKAALSQLQLSVEYDDMQLAKIPRRGPLVFVANHPFGVLDGLIICHIASITRRNFQILIHSALCKEERIASHMLPIDFSETKEAIRTNINTKKRAIQTLRQEGAIVIFPAGAIATSEGPFGKATDLEWKLFAAKLIQMTQATVVPIYFHGQNSRIFQVASQFSLTLRLSLIIREVKNKIGKTIRVSIGDPIPYQQISDIRQRKQLTRYLREVTYSLSQQNRRGTIRTYN